MKNLFFLYFLLFTTVAFSQNFAAINTKNSIIGRWYSGKANASFIFYEAADKKIFAKVEWLAKELIEKNVHIDKKNPNKFLKNRNLVGSDIISSLTFENENEATKLKNGTIYDYRTGKNFECSGILHNDKLEIRAFILNELFGKSVYFYKKPIGLAKN